MDRQTLRDWVHRYNVEGVAELSDRAQFGRAPKLTVEQEAEVAELVRAGPSLATHGVMRWRRKDLAGVIERRFGAVLAERSVGAMLKRLGFRRLSVRPRHPARAARPPLQVGLPVRRGLPRARCGRGPRAAVRQRGGDEPAPRRDR